MVGQISASLVADADSFSAGRKLLAAFHTARTRIVRSRHVNRGACEREDVGLSESTVTRLSRGHGLKHRLQLFEHGGFVRSGFAGSVDMLTHVSWVPEVARVTKVAEKIILPRTPVLGHCMCLEPVQPGLVLEQLGELLRCQRRCDDVGHRFFVRWG